MKEDSTPLYSERLLDYFRNSKYAGILPAPACAVVVENPACGDIVRLTAQVEDGVVRQAAFQVRGCTASIACGAALAEWLQGRSLDEVRLADVAEIIEGLVGGLAAESKHAAKLMSDAARRLGEGG